HAMKPDALRTFALSLPEAHEQPHFERTSFRVGKKIFATMTRDGSEAMVKLAVLEEVEELLAQQPEVFFSYGKWTERHGALGLRLSKVSASLMRALVTAAWQGVATKRARAAFAPSRPRPRREARS